jgi:DNA helicase-2/ATP-dependent DNA helicase PcrA
VTGIRARLADGTAPAEIAVLVRMNAQLAQLEEALTRAAIAYQVRGVRFYDRPEVRSALRSLRQLATDAQGRALARVIRDRWAASLGWEEGSLPDGDEARERQAALDTLLAIIDEHVALHSSADPASVLADLEARATHEREGTGEGVNLLTFHRAKGLEWDAVFLPSLEEGILPIRHAKDNEEAVAEERRLLYVGITRARQHLALSWAERREQRGRPTRREVSRFLLDLRPRPGSRVRQLPPTGVIAAREASERAARGTEDDPVFAALRAWRTARARAEAMPPYVIAHDATLAAIAAAHPRSMAALRRVKGMGPAKLDAYGEEILEIVAAAVPADAARDAGAGPTPPTGAGGVGAGGRAT